MGKILIYRVISNEEFIDLSNSKIFSGSKNTIEGKQFWLEIEDAEFYLNKATNSNFNPAYKYLLEIEIDKECLKNLQPEYMDLDGQKALHIDKLKLEEFNKCINFVKNHANGNII
jgi:hypothetical protein